MWFVWWAVGRAEGLHLHINGIWNGFPRYLGLPLYPHFAAVSCPWTSTHWDRPWWRKFALADCARLLDQFLFAGYKTNYCRWATVMMFHQAIEHLPFSRNAQRLLLINNNFDIPDQPENQPSFRTQHECLQNTKALHQPSSSYRKAHQIPIVFSSAARAFTESQEETKKVKNQISVSPRASTANIYTYRFSISPKKNSAFVLIFFISFDVFFQCLLFSMLNKSRFVISFEASTPTFDDEEMREK